jgi:hypothetical protein
MACGLFYFDSGKEDHRDASARLLQSPSPDG